MELAGSVEPRPAALPALNRKLHCTLQNLLTAAKREAIPVVAWSPGVPLRPSGRLVNL
jgi:hypothetical protein